MGDTKGGAFDIPEALAMEMLHAPEPARSPELRRDSCRGSTGWTYSSAAQHVDHRLRRRTCARRRRRGTSSRSRTSSDTFGRIAIRTNRDAYRRAVVDTRRGHGRRCARTALSYRGFLATPTVSKHRLFVWVDSRRPAGPANLSCSPRTMTTSSACLHSRVHEVWALRLRNASWKLGRGTRRPPVSRRFPFPSRRRSKRRRLRRRPRNWTNCAVAG